MPHAYGVKARTRSIFARPFRKHGQDPISRMLVSYHVGDYADIIVDGSKHKGMPHKLYYGRTGKIFDVSKRAVGIIVNKKVRNKILPKRLHVRFEHLRKSRCTEEFVNRIRANDKAKAEARKKNLHISTKRKPATPSEGHIVELAKTKVEYMNPKPHTELY